MKDWSEVRAVSHDEAKGIARRLIAGSFRRDGEVLEAAKRPNFSIPTRVDDDDDCLIMAYIAQQRAHTSASATGTGGEAFQSGVAEWMLACFNEAIAADIVERCDRFIEEALELAQANGWPAERAHALVDYVYGRDQGDINQEVGGVMVTLAALCNAIGVNMDAAARTELARVWTKVEAIRAKQAAKPTGSALPVAAPNYAPAQDWQERAEVAEAEVERLTKIVQACDWFWPEDDTSEDACQFSAGDIYCDMPEGEVCAVSRGGVVETLYYAWLPPAADADSDDDFEVCETSEEAAKAAVAAEIARRAASSADDPEPANA